MAKTKVVRPSEPQPPAPPGQPPTSTIEPPAPLWPNARIRKYVIWIFTILSLIAGTAWSLRQFFSQPMGPQLAFEFEAGPYAHSPVIAKEKTDLFNVFDQYDKDIEGYLKLKILNKGDRIAESVNIIWDDVKFTSAVSTQDEKRTIHPKSTRIEIGKLVPKESVRVELWSTKPYSDFGAPVISHANGSLIIRKEEPWIPNGLTLILIQLFTGGAIGAVVWLVMESLRNQQATIAERNETITRRTETIVEKNAAVIASLLKDMEDIYKNTNRNALGDVNKIINPDNQD